MACMAAIVQGVPEVLEAQAVLVPSIAGPVSPDMQEPSQQGARVEPADSEVPVVGRAESTTVEMVDTAGGCITGRRAPRTDLTMS